LQKLKEPLLPTVGHDVGCGVCRTTNGTVFELNWGTKKTSGLLFTVVCVNFYVVISSLPVNV
jgi:hypothetical protein